MKDIFIKTALLLSQKSKCVSKKVGAVVVKDNRIISMGYNGTIPKFKNCNEVFNENHYDRETHHEWSNMYELHAELNCIMFAAKNDIGINGCDLYVTLRPCDQCLKNIIQCGIRRVYYLFEYDKATDDNELLSNSYINIHLIKIFSEGNIKDFIEINNLKKLQ